MDDPKKRVAVVILLGSVIVGVVIIGVEVMGFLIRFSVIK